MSYGSSPYGSGPYGSEEAPLSGSPLANLSFEIDDGGGILPLAWTLTATASLEEVAVLTDGGTVESFETWAEPFELVFAPGDLSPASSNPDGFERLWFTNEHFAFQLTGTAVAVFTSGTGTSQIEDFELSWAGMNGTPGFTFEYAFAGGDLSAAVFTGSGQGSKENFEAGWHSVESFKLVFSETPDVDTRVFTIDGVESDHVEEFERFEAPHAVTVAAGTWTSPTGHTYGNTFTVTFSAVGGTLPEGILPGVNYWVINTDIGAGTFQVSLTEFGAAVVPTTTGTGVTYVQDAVEYWPTLMATL